MATASSARRSRNGLRPLLDEVTAVADALARPGAVVLAGVGGSRAYGLERPDSDVDLHGVFAAAPGELGGLDEVVWTRDRHEPDVCVHELRKFLHLVMSGSPNAIELLYCADYLVMTATGARLLAARPWLVGEQVRLAYLGAARDIYEKLERRHDSANPLSERVAGRSALAALRLLEQGHELVSTGALELRLEPRDAWEGVAQLPFGEVRARYRAGAARLQEVPSVLPGRPERDRVAALLLELRALAATA